MSLKNKILKLIFLIGIFYVLISFRGRVDATALSISVSKSSANVGDSINVTITSSYTGRVNLSASGGSLSDAKVWVEGNSQTVTLKSDSPGTIKITATAEGGTLSDNGQDVEINSQAATVTFKEKENTNNGSETTNTNENNSTTTATTTTKSSNANLSNLGITPNDFKGFKSGTTAYNVTVPNDVAQVTVYAKLQDSKAKLTGTGVQKLNVGKNTLNVVVTAEDGTKKTYTINVTREEAKSNTVENNTTSEETSKEEKSESQNEEKTSNSDLIKLEITGHKLTPEFSPDIYEYTLDVNGDISSLAVVAEGANHNVSVEVVGNTDLADGENTITVLVYNGETKKNSTYQIIVNKTNIDIEGLNTTLNDAIKKANKIRSILFGILIFIIVCIIIFIIVKHKYKVNSEHENDYEYDEEDKEKLNLDEEEEFFKRLNKEKIKEPEEEKVSTVAVANSIIEENKTDSKLSNEVKENDEEEDTTEEFFKTSKSKKKGKHF